MTTTSRYRCREHPAKPVTWRGTGCEPCQFRERARAAEIVSRRLEKAARRRRLDVDGLAAELASAHT